MHKLSIRNSLSIMTYNMHGFNQGEPLLSNVCTNNLYDIICLQEHWLSGNNLSQFNRFSEFTCYGISAMSNVTDRDILIGRPFGGVLTMVDNNLANYTKPLLMKERVVVLKISSFILINVYLPCKDKSNEYKEILLELFADISNAIDDVTYTNIILSGDFNNNLSNNKDDSCIIKNFLKSYNMSYIDIMVYNACEVYTFSNQTRGCSSIIDYICVSSPLVNCIEKYNTVCNAFNYSDHEPVEMKLGVSVMNDLCNANVNSTESIMNESCIGIEQCYDYRYRFDHGDVSGYYDATRVLFEPILNEIEFIYNALDYNINIDAVCNQLHIERLYNNIVDALLKSCQANIPLTKANHFKQWWDEELDELKQNCIASHEKWESCGRPRWGPIFEQRNRDKKIYRSLIQTRKSDNKQDLSNSLLYSLYNEEGAKFWKIWKNKAANNPFSLPKIEGASSESSACNMFKSYFAQLNTSDSDFDSKMHRNYQLLRKQRSVFNIVHEVKELNRDLYNALLIDISVSKLKNNKAAGIDGLQKEHLIFAHPIVYITLSKLFYIMMAKSYVPAQFGCGILVPIQKDSSLKGLQKLENFRGITLSPIISKIFEHSLLFLYGNVFKSSDRQLGFKAGLGCVHAIYCVRKVVDFFVSNDSTVNICCLDISKAFDKVNHNCLLYKLLQLSIPLCVVNILHDWYSKLFARVKFGHCMAQAFPIKCGVRQGSVLSPILFCIYIDKILKRLSSHGCHINEMCYGSFMYADDLILLAPSRSELIRMISIVCSELTSVGLKLNCDKSAYLRIGPRFHANCGPIESDFGSIPLVKETKYLGIILISHRNFMISFHDSKCKLYASFNNLYSKLGTSFDLNVIIHLLKTMVIPIIMYSLEAFSLNKSCINNLEFCLNRILFKIFKVSDSTNREYCMKMFNIDSIEDLYNKRKKHFVENLKNIENLTLRHLSKCLY